MSFLRFLLLTPLVGACGVLPANKLATAKRAPTTLDHVEWLSAKPSRLYDVIGRVTTPADVTPTSDTWHEELRKQAAKLGGDAVLLVAPAVSGGRIPLHDPAKMAFVIVWADTR